MLVNGTNRAISIVDLVAPNKIDDVTASDGDADFTFVGTSAAAPHVTGAAATVKDYFLANGHSWINSPGRLHTVMLSMGDRHRSSSPSSTTTYTNQSNTPDNWFGVGRMKLRPLFTGGGIDPVGWHMTTLTFTYSGQSYGKTVFSALPAGATFVKCTMFQQEDMSSKNDISQVTMEMRVTDCAGGRIATRTENGYDIKKVTAYETSTGGLEDECVELAWDAPHVTSSNVTLSTFCYYAGVDDDENPS